jgi:hypothetical protein
LRASIHTHVFFENFRLFVLPFVYMKLAARFAAAAQNSSDVKMVTGNAAGAGTVRCGGVNAGGWGATDMVSLE